MKLRITIEDIEGQVVITPDDCCYDLIDKARMSKAYDLYCETIDYLVDEGAVWDTTAKSPAAT